MMGQKPRGKGKIRIHYCNSMSNAVGWCWSYLDIVYCYPAWPTSMYPDFNSLNYYCSNYKYIGELNSLPECNYSTTKTTFKLTLEDNILLITSYEDLKNVIK